MITIKSTEIKIIWVIAGVLCIKLLAAYFIPLTGDEAYFTIWGRYPALGYYDHTPLIGWILHPLLYFGNANLLLRIPTILAITLMGLIIYWFIKPYDAKKAFWVSLLFLLSPVSLFGVLISNDVPLVFFAFLSGIFLFLALKDRDRASYYLLSGSCLGLAFFSKYFAVLLALSYLIYFLSMPKQRKRSIGFAILFLSVLPFGAINAYWNYTHTWPNILFNLFNRNESAYFQWSNLLHYGLILLYVITPPLFYYLCKSRKKIISELLHSEFAILTFSFLVPFLFFLGLATVKSVGVHWPLAFVPFVYITVFTILSERQLINCIKWNVAFSALHSIALAVALLLPFSVYQYFGFTGSKYANLIFSFKHAEIRQRLAPYDKYFIIASPSYSKAALMTADSGDYSPTIGMGSVHGRQDDLLVDFKDMQHKNFAILVTEPRDLNAYDVYFKHTEMNEFALYGAKFYLLLCYDFNYQLYRDRVLQNIFRRYWQVPGILPHTDNFFQKKYF